MLEIFTSSNWNPSLIVNSFKPQLFRALILIVLGHLQMFWSGFWWLRNWFVIIILTVFSLLFLYSIVFGHLLACFEFLSCNFVCIFWYRLNKKSMRSFKREYANTVPMQISQILLTLLRERWVAARLCIFLETTQNPSVVWTIFLFT